MVVVFVFRGGGLEFEWRSSWASRGGRGREGRRSREGSIYVCTNIYSLISLQNKKMLAMHGHHEHHRSKFYIFPPPPTHHTYIP